MNSASGVLGVLDDPALRDHVDRVAAAVGVRLVHQRGCPSRREWTAAASVVIDAAAVGRCTGGALPRRAQVILLVSDDPSDATWEAAISLGAQCVLRLPDRESELVELLSDAVETRAGAAGSVVAVIGGRGGAGGSVFSAALAMTAADALLVDVDPWGGGADLLLGIERQPGLRWSDVAVEGGRLSLAAVRDALPSRDGVGVLSGTRRGDDVAGGPLLAVVDAGRRGGATVVCDVPRRLTDAAEAALDAADLVVAVAACDVRSCASVTAMAPALLGINPNVGVVVRGPAPGGLRPAEVARASGLPLLAAMRPEPRLAERLEREGLRLRRRSSLVAAARQVLSVLDRHPATEAA
ncbi:MAG TPA: septum site-determining protein Ssd [Mycobacterium sp.]|jgi:secretion/DNA translocation related CpaE-like protein